MQMSMHKLNSIRLALDMAIEHYISRESNVKGEKLYILSDCKAAIDIIYNRHQTDQQAHVLTRVRSYLKTLHALRIEITLVWIPGHCDIHFHDLADSCAKDSIKNAYDIPTATLTLNTCKKMISKQCGALWQTRWNRSTVGRATYDLVPNVGIKHE